MLDTLLDSGFTITFALFVLLLVYLGVKIVPQSEVYVVERFGKYTRTLAAGLNLIVPLFGSHRAPRFDIGTSVT